MRVEGCQLSVGCDSRRPHGGGGGAGFGGTADGDVRFRGVRRVWVDRGMLWVEEWQQRAFHEGGDVVGGSEIGMHAGRTKCVFGAFIQALGDGDAIGTRASIAQSCDELGSWSEVAARVQPEHQAHGATKIDLLKQ